MEVESLLGRHLASGIQQLACRLLWWKSAPRRQAAREAGSSGPGGSDYCIIWEELNASIFASASASEWHLWEQNHRKRKKP